jgi:hypothetical protein
MILTTTSQDTYISYKYSISTNHTSRSFQIQSVCEKLEHVNSMKKKYLFYTVHSHIMDMQVMAFHPYKSNI